MLSRSDRPLDVGRANRLDRRGQRGSGGGREGPAAATAKSESRLHGQRGRQQGLQGDRRDPGQGKGRERLGLARPLGEGHELSEGAPTGAHGRSSSL